MEKIRLNIFLSQQLNDDLEALAEEAGASRTEIIRRAIALMKVANQAQKEGRYVGIVSDPKKLETLIVGI